MIIFVSTRDSYFETSHIGTVAVTTIHFWTSAAFYLYLDLTGKPGFLYKYWGCSYTNMGGWVVGGSSKCGNKEKVLTEANPPRYKMQQDKNFPVSPAKVWKVAKHVLVNQVRREHH